jgi:hypothetical protein
MDSWGTCEAELTLDLMRLLSKRLSRRGVSQPSRDMQRILGGMKAPCISGPRQSIKFASYEAMFSRCRRKR